MAIEDFANDRIDFFKKYLTLPYGIPSHDTLQRVFEWIDPKEFRSSFMKWIEEISAIHIVSVWASKYRIVIGQVKTVEKSNEITAIPELLKY